MSKRARLLIVDDSRLFRGLVADALAGVDEIEIVGSVWSGAKALEAVRAHPPDLVTLDVEMPGMNGLEVLAAMQEFNASRPDQPPVGVLMVSGFACRGAEVTVRALQAGAFDFVTKPTSASPEENLQTLREQLLAKVRLFLSRRGAVRAAPLPAVPSSSKMLSRTARAVVIGVSLGGPRALSLLLPELTRRVEVPILIVQHMPPCFTRSLAEGLARLTACPVLEAAGGEVVRPRTVYLAPGGKHLLVRGGRGGSVETAVNEHPPEGGWRPSANVLFRSAAAMYGADVVAVVLTGMGNDGTAGLGPIKRAGGHVIAQDEATSIVWGMPGSAVEAGLVDAVLPLDRIAAAVEPLCRRGAR